MADYLDGSPEPSNWQDSSSSDSSSGLNHFDAGEDSSPPTSPEPPSSIIEYTPATSLTDAGRDTLVTLVGLGVGFSITFRNDHSYTFDIHERPSAVQSCKSRRRGTASKYTDNAKGTSITGRHPSDDAIKKLAVIRNSRSQIPRRLGNAKARPPADHAANEAHQRITAGHEASNVNIKRGHDAARQSLYDLSTLAENPSARQVNSLEELLTGIEEKKEIIRTQEMQVEDLKARLEKKTESEEQLRDQVEALAGELSHASDRNKRLEIDLRGAEERLKCVSHAKYRICNKIDCITDIENEPDEDEVEYYGRKLNSLEEQLQQYKAQNTKLTKERDTFNEESKRLQRTKDQLSHEVLALEDERDNIRCQLQLSESRNAELTKERDGLQGFREAMHELNTKVDSKEEELQQTRAELRHHQGAFEELSKSYESLITKKARLENANGELVAERDNLQEEAQRSQAEHQQVLEGLQNRKDALSHRVVQLERALREKQAAIDNANGPLDNAIPEHASTLQGTSSSGRRAGGLPTVFSHNHSRTGALQDAPRYTRAQANSRRPGTRLIYYYRV
ncbi:hypothetical protein MPDQ_000522 [Monascus purpureus]|uniref:Uncharacterized protein n=1 Tax=Monascus purpureus TaxID=5098 RepID=A0A507R163_MONPU|nr:hypothetical protein MPDQ_000522 [Monascus purpureus]